MFQGFSVRPRVPQIAVIAQKVPQIASFHISIQAVPPNLFDSAQIVSLFLLNLFGQMTQPIFYID